MATIKRETRRDLVKHIFELLPKETIKEPMSKMLSSLTMQQLRNYRDSLTGKTPRMF